MRSGVGGHHLLKRSLTVLACGLLVGTLFWAAGVPRHPGTTEVPRDSPSPAEMRRSGVYVMSEAARAPASAPAPRRRDERAAQAPPLPFSYLGKVIEDGATTIVLHADGRTYKVRRPGPLDARYLVESIFDDRIVIRYLPLGIAEVLPLSARQDEVPPGLRAQYPQD